MKDFDYIIIGGGCAGLTLAYGHSITDDQSAASANDDTEHTMAINYVVGSISIGYQQSESQTGGANENGNNVFVFNGGWFCK